jgi:hypothetical protein
MLLSKLCCFSLLWLSTAHVAPCKIGPKNSPKSALNQVKINPKSSQDLQQIIPK